MNLLLSDAPVGVPLVLVKVDPPDLAMRMNRMGLRIDCEIMWL